jgi:hypothetical protein
MKKNKLNEMKKIEIKEKIQNVKIEKTEIGIILILNEDEKGEGVLYKKEKEKISKILSNIKINGKKEYEFKKINNMEGRYIFNQLYCDKICEYKTKITIDYFSNINLLNFNFINLNQNLLFSKNNFNLIFYNNLNEKNKQITYTNDGGINWNKLNILKEGDIKYFNKNKNGDIIYYFDDNNNLIFSDNFGKNWKQFQFLQPFSIINELIDFDDVNSFFLHVSLNQSSFLFLFNFNNFIFCDNISSFDFYFQFNFCFFGFYYFF